MNADSDYLVPAFTRHIDPDRVKVIFELGSRDCLDALKLSQHYEAWVVAFECNPEAIELCRRNSARSDRVRLVEAAVWDERKEIDFYPVIASQWRDGSPVTDGRGHVAVNIGASSCYRARGDYLQQYEQKAIRVAAIRLDEFCETHGFRFVDLLCLDLQGAALPALKGMGAHLETVRYIIAELEVKELYEGQSLFAEVDAYLGDRGFALVEQVPRDDWFNDYLYVRR